MKHPWTNVYGAARTVLAAGLLLTLLTDGIDVLFQPTAFRTAHEALPVYRISLFYLLSGSAAQLELARWLAVGALLLVASGWRPRLTGVLHWWVAFSFSGSTSLAEGGDQIHAILALLLVPVTLTDPRRWHWSSYAPDPAAVRSHVHETIASSALTMIRLQVAVVYFHAGISKLPVGEWANGTAVYYWFTHPIFGMSDPVRSLALPVLDHPIGVVALTWSVLVLEITLAAALVMERRHWAPLLLAGVVFHFGIVLAHGLVSFFFAMMGALMLYLRPTDEPFRLPVVVAPAAVRQILTRRLPRLGRAPLPPSAAR